MTRAPRGGMIRFTKVVVVLDELVRAFIDLNALKECLRLQLRRTTRPHYVAIETHCQ